jgi:hypothetical protein
MRIKRVHIQTGCCGWCRLWPQVGWGEFLADLKLFIPDQVQLNLFAVFEVKCCDQSAHGF